MKIKQAVDEKLTLLHKSPFLFVQDMTGIVDAILKNDRDLELARTNELALLISQTMQLADILGRRRALIEHDALSKREQPAQFSDYWKLPNHAVYRFDATPIFPRTEFKQAFDELAKRDPRLAKNAEQIREVYAAGGFAFQRMPDQLANQARMELTKKVQEKIVEFGREGKPVAEAVEEIQAAVAGSTRAYAETVYRTNLATAYTAGRFQQVLDPDIAEVIGALEYNIADETARQNHKYNDGLLAAPTDPVWAEHSPPQGFNCRCELRPVDRYELQQRRLLKNGAIRPKYPSMFHLAGPDRGFRKSGRTGSGNIYAV